MKRYRVYGLVFVGLSIFLASYDVHVTTWMAKTLLKKNEYGTIKNGLTLGPFVGFASSPPGTCVGQKEVIKITTNVFYPRQVYSKDAFEIKMTQYVVHAIGQIDGCGKDQHETPLVDSSRGAQVEDVEDLLWVLDIAGADASPKEPVKTQHGVVHWAVYPTQEGTIRAFARPKYDSDFAISIQNEEGIEIKVKDRLLTVRNALSWGAKFLGALITLPGILALLKQRRQEKEKRKRIEGEQERKRIIIEP